LSGQAFRDQKQAKTNSKFTIFGTDSQPPKIRAATTNDEKVPWNSGRFHLE
jgi:hypothetical protein